MTEPLVLVGTRDGIQALGHDVPRQPAGHVMNHVVRHGSSFWAISDNELVWRHDDDGEGDVVAEVAGGNLHCLLVTDERVLVGAGEATLYELAGDRLERVDAFDRVPGRDDWHTPWGAPPDVRSMSQDVDGTVYVNVHVGGVVRGRDGDWIDTMDIHADVHQVHAHPTVAGTAFVAAAIGFGVTTDGAETWTFDANGLHARYCRAVAVSDGMVFVSASQGPGDRQAAIYRRPIGSNEPFERCAGGLPEWFTGNVNTFCLAARGSFVVAGDPGGTVYLSRNDGQTWTPAAHGLPGVACLAVV